MKKVGFGVWVFILFIELFYFYNLNHTPHSIDEVLFIITVIIVTLVVGVVGLIGFKKN